MDGALPAGVADCAYFRRASVCGAHGGSGLRIWTPKSRRQRSALATRRAMGIYKGNATAHYGADDRFSWPSPAGWKYGFWFRRAEICRGVGGRAVEIIIRLEQYDYAGADGHRARHAARFVCDAIRHQLATASAAQGCGATAPVRHCSSRATPGCAYPACAFMWLYLSCCRCLSVFQRSICAGAADVSGNR